MKPLLLYLFAMYTSTQMIGKRIEGPNVWLEQYPPSTADLEEAKEYSYEVLPDENSVGRAMLQTLLEYAASYQGDISIVLLGGRGAQAMYKLLRPLSVSTEIDGLLSRLNVFTQDALAPMRMDNGLSFVRDFERLLGPAFFQKVKSFTAMHTDTDDLEGALQSYLEKMRSVGGIDIFFLGLGPEANDASHLCYIKPHSGAIATDLAGIIPISESILEHHISKFKAGGSVISKEDEEECRRATHILTLGPAAILNAKMIVQSIVDASTAPAKVACFRKLIETTFSKDPTEVALQANENPGLWVRLHPNTRTFILPDLLTDRTGN